MLKDWFKYETVVYEKEGGCYMRTRSSFFDRSIFSWQRIAAKMYPMGNSWMIETEKLLPEVLFETGKNIRDLTCVYDEISNILAELLGACYFDNDESIIKAIFTKTYPCSCEQEGYDYCQKLVKVCKEFWNLHKKFEDNCKRIMKE